MPPETVQQCPKKAKGSIVATVKRTDPGKVHGTPNKPLKGVTFEVTSKDGGKPKSGSTSGSGSVQFAKLPTSAYRIEAKVTGKLAQNFEIDPPFVEVAVADAAVAAAFKANRIAPASVTVKTTAAVAGLTVTLAGPKAATATTNDRGVADFGRLPIGAYTATVTVPPNHAADKQWMAPATPARLDVVRDTGASLEVTLLKRPQVTLTVATVSPATTPQGVKVTVTAGGRTADGTTDAKGTVKLEGLAPGEATITVTLEGDTARDWKLPDTLPKPALKAGADEAVRVELAPQASPVHLKFQLVLLEDAKHALPENLNLLVRYADARTVKAKLDAKGCLVDEKGAELKLERTQAFTLELAKHADTWIAFEKAGDPASQELVVDAAPGPTTKLGTAMGAGKRVLLLPQVDTKLVECAFVTTPADAHTEGSFAFKDKASLGTADAPITLDLKPRWQYVRFEFVDRAFGEKDHAGKAVAVPPVLVRGAASANDGKLAKAEVGANFVLHATDAAKTLQAIPWFTSKKPDGKTDLPKLTTKVVLHFGEKDLFVESKSATERALVRLDPVKDKDRRAPKLGRRKLYDLPETWTTAFQWTRLHDGKAKFFDELTEAELEASFDPAKALRFSLDDVCLTAKDGARTIQDQNATGGAVTIDQHSRVAVLYVDDKDGFAVKVHDPRDDAGYHSKTTFQKEAGSAAIRDVLVDLPWRARIVVFANGFHHLFDKRTKVADPAKKQALGLREARLEDVDVSAKVRPSSNGDVTNGYVHRTRQFDLHYAHGVAEDDTTIYSALVTHWSARVFSRTADKPTGWPAKGPVSNDLADARNYRSSGLAHAMKRWNAKGYAIELADDKKDVRISPFFLFEAKDVEHPANSGTFVTNGGRHTSWIGVGTDAKGSWANDTQMFMRRSGHRDEGAGWGSQPATEAKGLDYDGATGASRCALAHELGHAAVGLWDDYITQKWSSVVPGYAEEQRYPGVPYARDTDSIMKENRAVRLRQIWGRVAWVNDEAKASGKLHKFLEGKAFKATYAPSGKTKLSFDLKGATKQFYKPRRQALAHALGEKGVADLHFYDLGADEFSNLLPGGPFNGMLVVEHRICAVFAPGLVPAPAAWAKTTDYAIGACVQDGDDFYTCKVAHKAGDTRGAHAANWHKLTLDPGTAAFAWSAGTDADPGDWFEDGGVTYAAVEAFKLGSITRKHWVTLGASGPFAKATAYAIGAAVQDGGKLWACTKAHTSGDSRGTDWVEVRGATSPNYANQDYAVGDRCKVGGTHYVCVVAHKGQSAAAEAEDGRLVRTASTFTEWADDDAKKDWIVALNDGLVGQLEGDTGKFKLTGATPAELGGKTYVRAFPQWSTKAKETDADPQNTQFCVTVRRDDGTGFAASADKLKVGEKVKAATVMRYLLGRLSENAETRKTQTPEADLAPADLVKLKEFAETVVGGTFTAATI